MYRNSSVPSPIESRKKKVICFFILLLLFSIPEISLMNLNGRNHSIHISSFTLQTSALRGILSGIELIILVCFAVFYQKRGLYTAYLLSGISICTDLIPILKMQELNTIPGIFINTVGITTCVMIDRKHRSFNEEQDSLYYLAYYDHLTGLPNRRYTIETISKMCQGSNPHPFWLVVFHINNFQRINDMAGQQKGNPLLKKLTHDWHKLGNSNDFLGRINADEFVLLIPRKLSETELWNYIITIKNEICCGLPVLGTPDHCQNTSCPKQDILLSANFGIVSCPEHSTDAEEILKFADTALTVAQNSGPNTVRYFTKSMYNSLCEKTLLESALLCSLRNDECYLNFQPQYTANGKELHGFETLIRWNNKKLGNIPPSVFIPLAEETGFILTLGKWILKTALEQFKLLLKDYPDNLVLSVNISVLQLLHPDFIDMVTQVLEETGFNPKNLEFEITESIFITDKDEVIRILNQIKSLGISLALDDFGTSYSSLSYIEALPFDIIKIDKNFVDGILMSEKKAQLVDTILTVARQMDYKVVAEGVETQEQLSYLQARSCDYIQGYLWGKPLSMEDVTSLLAQQKQKISQSI